MKQVVRVILLVLVVGIAFGLGYFMQDMRNYLQHFSGPYVRSDSEARSGIYSIPERSYRVYQSHKGFQELDKFVAFSADRDVIETYLKGRFGLSLDSFTKAHEIPKKVLEQGPDSWDDEFRDVNWNLCKFDKFLLHDSESLTILYAADQNRLFVCEWAQ